MGFFDRLANLWRGFLGLWISDLESRNPEMVYEVAIEERVRKHRELKKAVAGIIYLRQKTAAELEAKEKELKQINLQIPQAVEDGEEDVALVLIQQKDELTRQVTELRAEMENIANKAEEAKRALIAFASEIDKLKREKEEMLAKKASAEARIQIQETLDGLSTDADIRALDGVREHINKLQAEADVGSEIKEDSLDAKLAKIRAKAATASARAQYDEMKRQLSARKAASAADPTEVPAGVAASVASDVRKTM
jgi:phage shock protein A